MRPLDQDSARARMRSWGLLGFALLLTTIVYWPGLSGGWLFDDYPNIVDNRGVQPSGGDLSSLVRAALSSPSSEFKRPLASLSFAANYLAGGLDPYWMKLTNLFIHLFNGLLIFLCTRRLLSSVQMRSAGTIGTAVAPHLNDGRGGILAALIAAAWLVLPINLTGVLYVVQRMESMANAFVLLGLLGYTAGRQRMLAGLRGGLVECVLSVIVPTALGLLAKETAVMLPLYAFLVEWLVFQFRRVGTGDSRDWRVALLFTLVLVLPMLAGLVWVMPQVLSPGAFSTRDFTLRERLLSEARIVTDYIGWTLLPTPGFLSFYHDDFRASTGLFHPWTTFASLLVLATMTWSVVRTRRSYPLFALGLALYLGCHLLTGTVLPLELVYEHRNYFASFGLLLAVIPLLAAPRESFVATEATSPINVHRALPMALPRYVALGGLLLFWALNTSLTAHAWGDPLRLAIELADRAPASPRAQYELGRMYIIYSHYERDSPFTQLAYAPLERAAAMPTSSILPQQALIFMNSRMGLPLKGSWWDSMIAKLEVRRPGVQDESSLSALTQCAREGLCHLPQQRMVSAFQAALSHPNPSARLLATYGDYAWNVLEDRQLGLGLTEKAIAAQPAEPAYRITCVRMLVALGRTSDAIREYQGLNRMNIGGNLDGELRSLHEAISTLSGHSQEELRQAPSLE